MEIGVSYNRTESSNTWNGKYKQWNSNTYSILPRDRILEDFFSKYVTDTPRKKDKNTEQ